MSFELVLLLVAFVLFPLIEVVMRAARQADRRVPDRAKGSLPSSNQPAKREPAMAAPAVPPPPPTARHTGQHATTARTRTSRRDLRDSEAPGPTARHVGRGQMALVEGLGDRIGLRRAIVLTAILGPCRAHDPNGRSESELP